VPASPLPVANEAGQNVLAEESKTDSAKPKAASRSFSPVVLVKKYLNILR